MNIGQLKEAIKDLPDDMELVGEFNNNQDDIWMVSLAKLQSDGIYTLIESGDIKEGDEINFLICLG